MMGYKPKHQRIISRRDTLKVCLVPAAGALGARWLIGCSTGTQQGVGSQLTAGVGAGQSAAQTPIAQAGVGAAGVTSVGAAGTGATAGSNAGSNAGAGGSSLPATAANGGSNAAAGSGGAAGQANGAGASGTAQSSAGATAQAGSGGAGGSVAGPGVPWAMGGTKAIMGNYPDPFTTGSQASACVVYPDQTIGPCYAAMPLMRKDISDGLIGLPMRMSFLLVHASSCKPVTGATIDIWHASSEGIYSQYATGTICNPGMEEVKAKTFCRGILTTDESGRVDFDSVFPGWYTGRTVHIHFTVRVNNSISKTSQIYFEDALTDDIQAQGSYVARGKRDTTNKNDKYYNQAGQTPDQILFTTAKRPDGALHAWKVLTIA